MHKILTDFKQKLQNTNFLYYTGLFLPVVFILWGSLGEGFLFTLDSQFTPAYNINNLDLGFDLVLVKNSLYALTKLIHPKVLQLIYFAVCLYIPAALSFRFLKKYVSNMAAFIASSFMICNPFVYERLVAGHLHIIFVLGLIIPYIHFLVSPTGRGRDLFLTLIVLIGSIVSPHILWFLLIPLSLNFLLSLKSFSLQNSDWKPILSFVAIACFEYLILYFKSIDSAENLYGLFLTGSPLSLFILEGMWTEKEGIVQKIFSLESGLSLIGWGILYLVFFIGVINFLKLNAMRFKFFSILLTSGLIGFLFSTLSISEFQTIYEKFFLIPGFGVMREGHKWLGLYVVSFVAILSLGINYIIPQFKNKLVLVTSLLIIILITSYKIFFLAEGQIKLADYPNNWYILQLEAEKNPGAKILVLPWEGYAEFQFVGGKYIADPTRLFFTNPVISSRFPINMNYLNNCDIQDLSFCIDYSDSKEEWKRFLNENNVEYILVNNTKEQSTNLEKFMTEKVDYALKIEENGNFVYFLHKK